MKITGLLSRSLAERESISYSVETSINNVTGSGSFGFSGENGTNYFCFKAGRIYDENNVYFASYVPDSKFTISGNISGDKYNYYFNNNPISFKGQGKGGKINSFFYDPSGIEFEANLKIKTKTFEKRFNFPETYTAGQPITGYFESTESGFSGYAVTGYSDHGSDGLFGNWLSYPPYTEACTLTGCVPFSGVHSHNSGFSGVTSGNRMKIFSGEVLGPDYWSLNSIETGVEGFSHEIVLQNEGSAKGQIGIEHDVSLILYTNLGHVNSTITTTSSSEFPTGGSEFSVLSKLDSFSGNATGTIGQITESEYSINYNMLLNEVLVVDPKPLYVSLEDIDTEKDIFGYHITGAQLSGTSSGLFTSQPNVSITSSGIPDLHASINVLTGFNKSYDLYEIDSLGTVGWKSGVDFFSITGFQVKDSGAYEDFNSVSVSVTDGLYTGSTNVIGYQEAGNTGTFFSTGNNANILDSHIKINASGVTANFSSSDSAFKRNFEDTWCVLTGIPSEIGTLSQMVSFNTGNFWNDYMIYYYPSGKTEFTSEGFLSGGKYESSGNVTENNIDLTIWNGNPYASSGSFTTISTGSNVYTFNDAVPAIDNRMTTTGGKMTEFPPTQILNPTSSYLHYIPVKPLKDLITGTIATGGTGQIDISYSFIKAGTVPTYTRRSSETTNFLSVDESFSGTKSQFTGEVGAAFTEWKNLFETVFTGLTLNFINKGEEDGSISWDHSQYASYPMKSNVGDIRIGNKSGVWVYPRIAVDSASQLANYYSTDAILYSAPYNKNSVLGSRGNYGMDIVMNGQRSFRLDDSPAVGTDLSTGGHWSIKRTFGAYIGWALGLAHSTNSGSIMYHPPSGTYNADFKQSDTFSAKFPNGLSGSKSDQDLVLYTYLGSGNTKSNSTYSAKLIVSGSGQGILNTVDTTPKFTVLPPMYFEQVITGGYFSENATTTTTTTSSSTSSTAGSSSGGDSGGGDSGGGGGGGGY